MAASHARSVPVVGMYQYFSLSCDGTPDIGKVVSGLTVLTQYSEEGVGEVTAAEARVRGCSQHSGLENGKPDQNFRWATAIQRPVPHDRPLSLISQNHADVGDHVGDQVFK